MSKHENTTLTTELSLHCKLQDSIVQWLILASQQESFELN